MDTVKKVIVNTAVLYLKIICSMVIALVSVPLVLHTLGASDYGLYNLVAGLVAMLAFLNNSLTVSTQRFLSVAMGANNTEHINTIYNASFVLHFLLGILVLVFFEIVGFIAIDYLNIPADRLGVAKIIFQFVLCSTFVNIISVPFDAMINANEDMIPYSIIGIIDSLLNLTLAFTLQFLNIDRLMFYGMGVSLVALLSFVMKYSWTRRSYKQYKLSRSTIISRDQYRSMFSFAGWNLFGGLAMMGRNQGVAIVINHFFGTVANAAYGIANQINGALSQFSSTFQKAINPQLMKSEGMNNRERLIRISYISSKFSVLALCLFAIPLIIEMDQVLSIWLFDDIPPYTQRLSQWILMLSIVTQFSIGIMSCIQATGQIKEYQITIGTILLLNIPISYIVFCLGSPVYYATIAFVVTEGFSLVVRLRLAKKIVGMKLADYLINVIRPTFIVLIVSTLAALVIHAIMPYSFVRLICVCFVYGIIYFVLTWFFALNNDDRKRIVSKFVR